MKCIGENRCLKIAEDSSNVEHVKAEFAFYLLLAYDFDTFYTILSSLWKDYMIKPEKGFFFFFKYYQILDRGGGRR